MQAQGVHARIAQEYFQLASCRRVVLKGGIDVFFYTVKHYSSLNKTVDKYLSPVSGNTTTINFPLFSGLAATCNAANAAAPDEMPAKMPSSRAN